MVSMTFPAAPRRTAAEGPPVRRLTLVPADGRSGTQAVTGSRDYLTGKDSVRRFRLARLRLEDREVARAERFAHLSRAHD
jgi:hypothetical protein